MNYAILIYLDENHFYSLPKDEQNQVHGECGAWHEKIVATGRFRGALGLQPSSATSTLKAKDGKVLVMDGPFAETKEVLGGLEQVECDSLEEALAIAREFPALRVGATVEVRPLVLGNKCEAV